VSDMREPPVLAESSTPVRLERRRPGRMANVSPALIPLLRGQVRVPTDHEERRADALRPATGIAVSLLISGLIWALLIWLI
jgi:hypothetical protein